MSIAVLLFATCWYLKDGRVWAVDYFVLPLAIH